MFSSPQDSPKRVLSSQAQAVRRWSTCARFNGKSKITLAGDYDKRIRAFLSMIILNECLPAASDKDTAALPSVGKSSEYVCRAS